VYRLSVGTLPVISRVSPKGVYRISPILFPPLFSITLALPRLAPAQAGAVAHEEGQRRPFAHGDALRSRVVVRARHARADVLLVDRAEVDRRLAVLYFLDAVAVAIVIILYALTGVGSPFWGEQATTTDPESAQPGISRFFMGLSQLRCHYATATPVYDNESSTLSRYMLD